MGIQRMRECIHEGLEDIVTLDLIHSFQETQITLLEDRLCFFPALVGKRQAEGVIFDTLLP